MTWPVNSKRRLMCCRGCGTDTQSVYGYCGVCREQGVHWMEDEFIQYGPSANLQEGDDEWEEE